MTTMTHDIARIRELNDNCRLGLDRNAKIVITSNCLAAFAPGDSGPEQIIAQARIMKAVRSHCFADNPDDEHDFGRVTLGAQVLFFKIDYYDLDLEYGSEDPSNAAVTRRVMTIMLASDY